MRGLAQFAMRGPTNAALLSATFALLSLFVAPALVVSGALLALVLLRHGLAAALRTLAVAAAMTAVVLFAISGGVGAAAAVIVATWLPVLGASATLRRTGSQGKALANIGICVAAYAILMRMANADVDAFWRDRLTVLSDALETQGAKALLTPEQIALYGGWMHPASIATFCVILLATLLLARWWQAALYKPGGFGEEFRTLALPRWISPVGAVIAAGMLVARLTENKAGIAQDLLLILVILFSMQGLAVLHAGCAAKALGRGWMVGTYILLGVVPQVVVPVLATTGIVDVVVDFRRRLRRGVN